MSQEKLSQKNNSIEHRPKQNGSSNAQADFVATDAAPATDDNNNNTAPNPKSDNTEEAHKKAAFNFPGRRIVSSLSTSHHSLTPDDNTFYFLTAMYLMIVCYLDEHQTYQIVRQSCRTNQILKQVCLFRFDSLPPSLHLVPGARRVFAYLPWSHQLVLFLPHGRVAIVELMIVTGEPVYLLPPPTFIDFCALYDPRLLSEVLQWNAVTVDEEAELLFVQAEMVEVVLELPEHTKNSTSSSTKNSEEKNKEKKKKNPLKVLVKQDLCILDVESQSVTPWRLAPDSEQFRLGPALFLNLVITSSEGDEDERHLMIGIKEVHQVRRRHRGPRPNRKRPNRPRRHRNKGKGKGKGNPQSSASTSSPSKKQPNSTSSSSATQELVSLTAITHLTLVKAAALGETIVFDFNQHPEYKRILHQQAAILMAPGSVAPTNDGSFHLMIVPPPNNSSASTKHPSEPYCCRMSLLVSSIVPRRPTGGCRRPPLFTGFGLTGHYGPSSSWRSFLEGYCPEPWTPFAQEKKVGGEARAIATASAEQFFLVSDAVDLYLIFRRPGKEIFYRYRQQSLLSIESYRDDDDDDDD